VVGDTVVANFSGCCGFPTITSIDSILIGLNYRKKFNVDGGAYRYIEGIGGSWGFIEQLVTFESGSSLICFSENNQTLFPDTTSTCFIITSASKDLKGSETFKLYPNPTNQFTTLEFTNPTQQNCTLRLYDLRGQVVRTINNITTDQIGIERQSFASGLYFFQLRTDRQIIANGKLIIE
jgi:hypothetical protein